MTRNHDLVRPSRPVVALDRLLRLASAGCLAIDAFVHADLADTYAEGGGTINEGTLFRVEAAVAGLAALVILVSGRRVSYLMAFAVAASALAVTMSGACVEWRGEIGAYIVGALDRDAAAAVRSHLMHCADCRAEYDELAPLRTLLDLLSNHRARI